MAELCFVKINFIGVGGGWMVGWLEKAEIKPTQPSWSWSLAELGNFRLLLCNVIINKRYSLKFDFLISCS